MNWLWHTLFLAFMWTSIPFLLGAFMRTVWFMFMLGWGWL